MKLFMTAPKLEIYDLFDWKDRPVAPFNVRVALDETGIYAGDLDTRLAACLEDETLYGSPVSPVAVITRKKMNPELEGSWHIFLGIPENWKEARVSIRVFESTYDALDALLPTVPRDLIQVLP